MHLSKLSLAFYVNLKQAKKPAPMKYDQYSIQFSNQIAVRKLDSQEEKDWKKVLYLC